MEYVTSIAGFLDEMLVEQSFHQTPGSTQVGVGQRGRRMQAEVLIGVDSESTENLPLVRRKAVIREFEGCQDVDVPFVDFAEPIMRRDQLRKEIGYPP